VAQKLAQIVSSFLRGCTVVPILQLANLVALLLLHIRAAHNINRLGIGFSLEEWARSYAAILYVTS
jgi:hypothetical protein